jgi:inhibitor of KinA
MAPHFLPLSESALLLSWGNCIDPVINDQVQALYRRLAERALPGILDYIPAYSSLTLVLDAAYFDRFHPGEAPLQMARALVEAAMETNNLAGVCTPGEVTAQNLAGVKSIPVCYDPAFAPDLLPLADRLGISVDQLVQIHTAETYKVYMLGFLPGFAYMGTVDERIAAPRLSRPRREVPAGSVGIAGRQTGIYPLDAPGGWNLIGRTPLRMFDAHRAEPVLLRPGDLVRFYPVSPEVYHQMAQSQ